MRGDQSGPDESSRLRRDDATGRDGTYPLPHRMMVTTVAWKGRTSGTYGTVQAALSAFSTGTTTPPTFDGSRQPLR
jgi:hypothetical protein